MRNSILIIATVVFSLLNMNATTSNTNPNTTMENVEIAKDDLIQVYDWTVKTTNGEFSGTALTLFDAKRMANIVGQAEVVLERQINSYYMLASELNQKEARLYYWEADSKNAKAQGFASSEFTAKRMIQLVTKGDIINYRIIASSPK
ncbi:hypothetical protein Q4512_06005 [Oceanihabitans sp. 2_MG-2023]|uniref:hypothetical protein n=1 Tax=Oceanihabitans sp. 2_MG-2023 TaxID=3062661 RepID=UPI0026E39D35|nr:hypothetical protein [Oceanihabitans sp. 2_MG-2023]MDO6596459.1 hypothetical protein [Oceanihabitans sp. 2_MG-2023]